jgi:two-component system response regulator FlrC
VRELENVIRRALVLAGNAPVLMPGHIAFDRPARLISEPVQSVATGDSKLSNIVQISESRAILATLDACNGSRVAAARQLGISERTLRYRLASLREAGIEVNGRAVGGRR